jgi:hypothetical protein
MALKKNMRNPNFILGGISLILFIFGIVLKGNSYEVGNLILLASIVLGAVHWIWGIIDVSSGEDLKPDSKIFWLILVGLIPPLGGMFYYMMKRKNVTM